MIRSSHLFDQVCRIDQVCRTKAIKLACELGMPTLLNINFMPNAIYQPDLCIRTTLAAAEQYGFPIERIVLEITESEKVEDLLQSQRNLPAALLVGQVISLEQATK